MHAKTDSLYSITNINPFSTTRKKLNANDHNKSGCEIETHNTNWMSYLNLIDCMWPISVHCELSHSENSGKSWLDTCIIRMNSNGDYKQIALHWIDDVICSLIWCGRVKTDFALNMPEVLLNEATKIPSHSTRHFFFPVFHFSPFVLWI